MPATDSSRSAETLELWTPQTPRGSDPIFLVNKRSLPRIRYFSAPTSVPFPPYCVSSPKIRYTRCDSMRTSEPFWNADASFRLCTLCNDNLPLQGVTNCYVWSGSVPGNSWSIFCAPFLFNFAALAFWSRCWLVRHQARFEERKIIEQ